MNAVRALGVVLDILLVENLWNDWKCAEMMSHQAVEKDLGDLTALADFIFIREPEVLSRRNETAVVLVDKCCSLSLRQRGLGDVIPQIALEFGVAPFRIFKAVDQAENTLLD
ncbi:hypothetical protein MTBUT4_250001 [Magnetospirillum sp. UT-4]|nr:hypothetical protein MTBUT4_250001 [Magnetospirillum sp. UT-4]